MAVLWVGEDGVKDLWNRLVFKSGMEKRGVMDGVMVVTDDERG